MTDRKKTVMILGAGVMQLPAIRAAKRLGWKTVVVDADASAPGQALADHFLAIDLKEKCAIEIAARECRSKQGLDGIFTAGTDFSATVAWVAEQLGLPGIPFQTALDATNKIRMRTKLAEKGLPIPRFYGVWNPVDAVHPKLPFPLVVKPVDNMGARGVRRVDSDADWLEAVKDAVAASRCGQIIVEEYVDGPEFSIDAVVDDHGIRICGIADRHIFFEPYFVEMGHTMPSAADPDVVQRVLATFRDAVQALGIDQGAAKGDMKYSSRGPVVGEIAARLSGGYMSGWTYPYSSGHSVTETALRIAVGEYDSTIRNGKQWVSAERAFISIPGSVARIEGLNRARSSPWIRDVFLRVGVGDPVRFPRNNVQKGGNFISAAPDRQRAVQAAERACRTVFLRLQDSVESTGRYLFGAPEAHCPDAFKPVHPANIAFFSSLTLPEAGEWTGETISLPPESEREAATDWHGMTFYEGCRAVAKKTGVRFIISEPLFSDFLFWRAYLRGGVQGAVWLLDTLKRFRAEKRDLAAAWRVWSVR